MATFNEWCLSTIQQVQTDIGPGVSGWDSEIEGTDLRGLIAAAQETQGVPDEMVISVRNRVAGQIFEEIPGSGSERSQEKAAANGQMLAALVATESHFQDLVDEDDAEA